MTIDLFYSNALMHTTKPRMTNSKPVMRFKIHKPRMLKRLRNLLTNKVSVSHQLNAPNKMEHNPTTFSYHVCSGVKKLNCANRPMNMKIISGLLKQSPNAEM